MTCYMAYELNGSVWSDPGSKVHGQMDEQKGFSESLFYIVALSVANNGIPKWCIYFQISLRKSVLVSVGAALFLL